MITQIEQAYEMVENSSEPKFVPVNRSAREMKLLYSQHVKESAQQKNLKQRIAFVLKNHSIEKEKAKKIIRKNSDIEEHQPFQGANDSMRTTRSINQKKFEEVKKIHDEVKAVPKVIVAKKRFLNWDPMKVFNGDSIDPQEIIQSTRKIQTTLARGAQLQEELDQLPQSVAEVPDVDTPLLPTHIRNSKEYDMDMRKRQRERFFERFEKGRQMQEEREKVWENSPDRNALEQQHEEEMRLISNSMLPKIIARQKRKEELERLNAGQQHRDGNINISRKKTLEEV